MEEEDGELELGDGPPDDELQEPYYYGEWMKW
jgi:hypothetical protein